MCIRGGEGECTGKHSFLIVGGPLSSLWYGEYSVGAYPFFSPLLNTGALSFLQIQLFSQVPSDMAFHFPTLRVLLPPSATALLSSLPGSLCPIKLDRPVSQVSRPPTQSLLHPSPPALSRGLTSRAEVSVFSPNPGISIFGDCAPSSDGPFSSASAFQNSTLLLHSSLHVEIPRGRSIFPPSR